MMISKQIILTLQTLKGMHLPYHFQIVNNLAITFLKYLGSLLATR